jgi:ABC-2 type transport system permease protein
MEMRKNTVSLLLWMFAITLLISVTMSVYPTFVENQSKVLGMMSLVPKGALQFKGISNFTDMLSVLGFYSVNNVIYMMVLGSIFSIVLASNILLKEEYNKTAEYLLTRPLSRVNIFFSKMAVLYIYIFLLNLVTALAGFVSMELIKNSSFSVRAFLILSLYTLLLNLLFGAIGLFMSTLVKRPKPITTFSIGLVLFFYFIFTLSKITESVAKIGYLSPFKYVNTEAFNPAYKLGFWHLMYFAGISLLLTTISYRLYCRKDIYT